MKIREAERKDAAVLDAMLTELIHYEHRFDQNLDRDYRVTGNYSNMIGRDGCKIWIAEEGDSACGFLCAILYDLPVYVKPVVILDALYICEEHRRKGCATSLMAELKRYAASVHAHAIELKVYSANAQASRLYSRAGFTETKKYLQLDIGPAGDPYPDIQQ